MRLSRTLLIAVVPPAVSTTLAIFTYVLGGGREACFEDLGLDTPGLACATFFHLALATTIFIVLHLAVALPLALLIRRVYGRGLARRLMTQRWAERILFAAFALWVAGIVLARTASGPRWPAGLLDLLVPAVVQITLVFLFVHNGTTQSGFPWGARNHPR